MKTLSIILIIFASISFFIPLVGGTIAPLAIALFLCIVMLSKQARNLAFIALALNTLNTVISPMAWHDFSEGSTSSISYAHLILSVELFAVFVALITAFLQREKNKIGKPQEQQV